MDRLTKSVHFIPFRLEQSMDLLDEKYMQEVVRLHGMPVNVVSDRDTRFFIPLLEKSPRMFRNTLEV